jgi:hypothetical protein
MLVKPLVIKSGQIEQQQAGDGLKLNLGPAAPLTIVGGAVTIIGSYHEIDTEGAASSDNLDVINGGVEGDILILRAVNDGRTVVVRDNQGNCRLTSNCSLNHSHDTLTLLFNGSVWLELTRSNNG